MMSQVQAVACSEVAGIRLIVLFACSEVPHNPLLTPPMLPPPLPPPGVTSQQFDIRKAYGHAW